MPRFPAALLFLLSANLLAQAAAQTCAIDGSVVNATTGEPVARARVLLMGPAGQKTGLTDSTGHWNFQTASCGQNQILATRPGFLQGAFGQPRLGAAFRPVILVSGEPLHDAKILLTPQAVIAGKVTDDQGDPIQGVQIFALSPRVVAGLRTFQSGISVTTNDLGDYRLAGLIPGKYIVCAYPSGPSNNFDETDGATVVGSRCFPGSPETPSAAAMDARGPDTRVDFTLSRVPAVKIRGTIVNAPRGVGIALVRRIATNFNRPQPGNVRPDGTFEIAPVTPGSYTLAVDFFDSGKRLTARVPLDVGGADFDGVTIHLESGFSVTGTVRMESKKDPLASIPQVGLNLHSTEPQSGAGQMVWSKTRDSFTVNDLPPGSYRLEAFPNGPWYLKSATLGGRDISNEAIPLTQSSGPIEIVLSDDAGSLEGQIEDSDGKPVAAWIMVLQQGRSPRNTMSQSDGRFTLGNLAPGDYKVYAWDDWQQVEYANPEWMRNNASPTSVTIDSGQTVRVKLRRHLVPAW